MVKTDETRLALDARNISKTFGATRALRALDLSIERGEVHALVGENGCGKSTFIKILSGYFSPDPGGDVLVAGDQLPWGAPKQAHHLGCRFVHQDLGLIEDLSILDNFLMSVGFPMRWGTVQYRKARQIVKDDLENIGIEADPNTSVRELTPGMRSGIAIARALHEDGETPVRLLVLDEPTATLPNGDVNRLLDTIRRVTSRGVGVLYVSHRLDEVFDIADRISVLRDGQKIRTGLRTELSRQDLIQMMVGHEFEEASAAARRLPSQAIGQTPAMRIEHLVSYPVNDVSMTIHAGELVGIAGIIGSGRETFLQSVFGASHRDAGKVLINGVELRDFRPSEAIEQGVAFVPADRKVQSALLDATIRENLTLVNLKPFWRRGRLSRAGEVAETRHWLKAMGIRRFSDTELPLRAFSGGNQQRVVLGKWLRCEPRVLLLDEPTQGVDVGAKAQLHAQLIEAVSVGMAVVVSSSDADELAALCQRVIIFRNGRIGAELRDDEVSAQEIARECLGAEAMAG